jgi:hypothetical protein
MNYIEEFNIKSIDIWYGKHITILTIYNRELIRYCKTYHAIIDADKLILEEVPKYLTWQ